MSYMSATAGCDREQSEAPHYDSTTPPRFAKPHHSSLLKEEKGVVMSPFPTLDKAGCHSDDGAVEELVMSRYANPHRSGNLRRHSFELTIARTHIKSIAYFTNKCKPYLMANSLSILSPSTLKAEFTFISFFTVSR